ncbi:hypothetical protein ACMY46_06155 [Bartonella bacilliformis]|uniref:hypothetical protein n=1 Tax=Bartonella bacilliformis TaxID=774 RepID=UPI0004A0D6DE|nr:hypothetical protein [Bartonella bacilliformis]KEG17046.1 hypothetical protein H705_00939 [Bartonella bacilliformis Cond044]
MSQKTYVILIDADFVVGNRSAGKGEEIRLSEEAAKYPLLLGQIAEKQVTAAPLGKTVKGT